MASLAAGAEMPRDVRLRGAGEPGDLDLWEWLTISAAAFLIRHPIPRYSLLRCAADGKFVVRGEADAAMGTAIMPGAQQTSPLNGLM
jgi:hypothetical protein